MTSCNMGLKTDILLFVLPCIFLSPYIFRQRYQPYALEALKRGIVRYSDSSSICYLFFVSMQSKLQFFVIDFSATVQDRRLIFCI